MIHHQPRYETLTYKDTNVAHWLENIIQPLGFFVPVMIHGYDDNGGYVTLPVLMISVLVIYIRGLMRHDHRYTWLVGNHHLLHHRYRNYNYGEYWIDIIFNTDYPNKNDYIYGWIYT